MLILSYSILRGQGGDQMIPDRVSFLNKFDIFYQVIVNAIKENKINERDFYIILGAKCKSMNQERRESLLLLNKKAG